MTTKKIYLLPGLGADARMYEPQLKVLRNTKVLEHFVPEKKDTLATYAQKISTQIDTTTPYILIGTSLGGMVAMELSKILQPDKVILLASVKARSELPIWMRSMKYLNAHKLMSGKNFRDLSNANIRRLISKRDTRVAQLLRDMHDSANLEFIEWAINAIVKWKSPQEIRPDIIHLHGTADRLFPFRNAKNAIPIKGGSHVMNLTQPHDINRVLLEILEEVV